MYCLKALTISELSTSCTFRYRFLLMVRVFLAASKMGSTRGATRAGAHRRTSWYVEVSRAEGRQSGWPFDDAASLGVGRQLTIHHLELSPSQGADLRVMRHQHQRC